MQRWLAFTLIEIVLAVFILMLLLLLAVPSLSGVLANNRLRRSLNGFNNLVRHAQERSVTERRPYLIVWNKNNVVTRPETFAEAEEVLKKDREKLLPENVSKLEYACKACEGGIERVHIINGRSEEGLLAEVFSSEGVGTLIYDLDAPDFSKGARLASEGTSRETAGSSTFAIAVESIFSGVIAWTNSRRIDICIGVSGNTVSPNFITTLAALASFASSPKFTFRIDMLSSVNPLLLLVAPTRAIEGSADRIAFALSSSDFAYVSKPKSRI